MTTTNWKFELGEILEDKVTGYQGVVMARAEYFTDCVHYGLCARAAKEGKLPDWQWLDETRLVSIGQSIKKEERFSHTTGTSGPSENPTNNVSGPEM